MRAGKKNKNPNTKKNPKSKIQILKFLNFKKSFILLPVYEGLAALLYVHYSDTFGTLPPHTPLGTKEEGKEAA